MAKNQFLGSWRITEMEVWDEDFLDMEVTAHITFQREGMGEFQFGLVHGWLDCRFGKRDGNPLVEFSWAGQDEMDDASGRGWAVLTDDELKGRLFIHNGDDSSFKAIKMMSNGKAK